jgi:S1-C subfamily serine protease
LWLPWQGEVTSYDRVSDIAVLKVQSEEPLPTVKLGSSAGLRVGEWVVSLGSPLHLQNSVTHGIISCVDRKVATSPQTGIKTGTWKLCTSTF